MCDPIAYYTLGFVDCDHIVARCMLTTFTLFAMGSPQPSLHDTIEYLEERGVKTAPLRG